MVTSNPSLVDVKTLRERQIGGLEMDVAHDRAGIDALPLARRRAARLEHALGVHLRRADQEFVALVPVLARAVAIDLDAVAVRIAQVQRLAHEVLGRAGEAGIDVDEVLHLLAERCARRHQQGEMEQIGRVRRRACRRAAPPAPAAAGRARRAPPAHSRAPEAPARSCAGSSRASGQDRPTPSATAPISIVSGRNVMSCFPARRACVPR